ncbi:MAG: ATP-binding protein [Bacillota bacterium]
MGQNIISKKEYSPTCRMDISEMLSPFAGDAMSEFGLLKKIIDLSLDGIAIFNKSYKLVYINISFAKMSGYSMAELNGLSIKDFCDRLLPLQTLRMPFDIYAFGDEDYFSSYKYNLITKEHDEIPIQIALLKVMESRKGELSGCAMIFHNIRPHIEAQRWAAKSSILLCNIKVGVMAVNKKQIITVFNKVAEEKTGLNQSEVIGKHHDEVFEHLTQEQKYLLTTLLYGIEFVGKEINYCPYQQRDGIFILTTAQIKDDFGEVNGAMAIFEDHTEQRKYEQEIARAERLAMVSEIAAGMAHEIRNPLTTAKGFIQLMRKQIENNIDLQGYATIALDELDRANGIISEFLSLTKTNKIDMVDANINEILRQIITLVESQANMQGIKINTHLDQRLPHGKMDSGKIKQVFINLVQNAMQAMPGGGTLNIQTTWDDNIKVISTEVADSGQGIPSEHISKIFAPFFSTKETGTGLGLTLSNRIIQNHGGTVEVTSKVGVGSTFIVKLPLENYQPR